MLQNLILVSISMKQVNFIILLMCKVIFMSEFFPDQD